jgi:hypothetical protein
MRYMNRYRGMKRFLYITPYLKEVERVCELCDFEQPDSDHLSKSTELKTHIRKGNNVAATHSLFYLMDEETLELARGRNYSLIIDESIDVISRFNTTDKDFDIITQLTEERKNGALRWIDGDYTGRFCDYKDAADIGSLFKLDHALLNIMNPLMLQAFDEVFMLTYLFDGQYQKAYLDFFGLEYRTVGVERDDDGYYFSDSPDVPLPIDYRRLIHIIDNEQVNRAGRSSYALSKNWYAKRGRDNRDIKDLRNGMRNFFEKISKGDSDSRLWTCFKEEQSKLIAENGRYRNNFLQINARATNEFRDKTDVAYMVNRFADPNILKFFSSKGIEINRDNFALSEMLQWIWRSAIRDDKPINLYIPSSRMRTFLTNWINAVS